MHDSDKNTSTSQSILLQWKRRLEKECSQHELEELCWRLEIDPETLRHQTKTELALDLVQYLHRRNRIDDLDTAYKESQTQRSDTLKAYTEHLLAETEFLELRGIPLPRGRDGRVHELHIPLEKIYIQLQVIGKEVRDQEEQAETQAVETVTKAAQERVSGKLESHLFPAVHTLGWYLYQQGQYQPSESFQPIDPLRALEQHKRLVIMGPPGAGKSTLLRFLARRTVVEAKELIPILVSLRDYASAHSHRQSLNLREFSLDIAAADNRSLRLALDAAAEEGRVLWLLDALDETHHLASAVLSQVAKLTGQLVLTSRPIGYLSGPLRRLPHFEILPLTLEMAREFLREWLSLLSDKNTDREVVNRQIAELENRLADWPRAQTLTRSPLLLTFLVTLAARGGLPDLPLKRAQLYERYVEELLNWEIQRLAQSSNVSDYEFSLGFQKGSAARRAARDSLCYLGWALHLHYYGGRGLTTPGPAALEEKLVTYLKQDGYSEPEILAKSALEFWRQAGMLDVWQIAGHDYLAFRHLTFQEYAAAWGLHRSWLRNQKQTRHFLQPRLHHPAWREPVLFWSSLLTVPARKSVLHRLRRGISRDEPILHRDLTLAAAILSENQLSSDVEAQKIIKKLAWLGRSHTYQVVWTLLTFYGIGIAIMLLVFPDFLHIVAATLWSIVWLGSYPITCFPRIQSVLGLPLMIRGLASTPFLLAYKSLASIGSSTIPILLSALQDNDGSVRQAAVESLGKIGSSNESPLLIMMLQDKEDTVREAAVVAMLKIEEGHALLHLTPLLVDKSKAVRLQLAMQLGRLGNEGAISYLLFLFLDNFEKTPDVAEAAIRALGRIGTTAIMLSILYLRDDYDKVEFAIHHFSEYINDGSLAPVLVETLFESEGRPRISTSFFAAALRKVRETAVPLLILGLQDDREFVRRVSAEALGVIEESSAVPRLHDVLEDSSPDVCIAATEALARLKDILAIETFIANMRSEHSGIRKASVRALGRVGDSSAVPYLVSALEDEDKSVRSEAAWSLSSIGDSDLVPVFLELLLNGHAGYLAAAKGLSQLADSSVILRVATALQSEDREVRVAAVRVLGDIGGTDVLPYLFSAFKDSDGGVRSSAITAMGKVGNPAVFRYLLEGLQDKEEFARWHAALALSESTNVDSAAVPYLVKALKDENEYVRYYAAEALGQIGDPAAVSHLLGLIVDEERAVRGAAIEAIQQTGAAAVPSLLTALKHSSLFIRAEATLALGWLATSIQNTQPLKGACWPLWGRITEVEIVLPSPASQAAKIALERVNSQLGILNVARLPLTDPLNFDRSTKPVKRRLYYGVRLIVVSAAAVLVEMIASLLSDRLSELLPTGAIGAITLGILLLILFSIDRKLDS